MDITTLLSTPLTTCSSHLAIHDGDLLPIKPRQDEPCEALVVGPTIVAQQANGLLLPHQQPLTAIGPIVHPGRIAAQRDVAREFVDFVAEGQRRSLPWLHSSAISSCLHRLGKNVLLIKESFQDGGA